MPAVSTVEARNDFSTVLNRAAFGKERVILARRGKAIAAIVPIEDVRLLRALEDRADLADAIAAEREALKKGTISLADLKRDLAL
ncbi:MAG: type II toxin-antitoxin system Phd/YefM family antitoxin [Bryobacteraceae bacterium]